MGTALARVSAYVRPGWVEPPTLATHQQDGLAAWPNPGARAALITAYPIVSCLTPSLVKPRAVHGTLSRVVA